ncbi:MAG TPA: nucleoside-diphosphate sugar epimerase/dehydratase [Candidatus Limnocylindrales bacterium]|nr:nucleoside-diphosphate sugar epimerase/dehydratase [Candidatus Limnocylindrales bacterium]
MLLRLRFWFILAFDTILFAASLIGAWLLRFEFTLPQRDILFAALPILVLMRLAALGRFKLLRGYWRYTGISDIADIVKATALGSLGFLVIERWLLGIKAFPISIYCLEALLVVGGLCGARLFSRMLAQSVRGAWRGRSEKTAIIVGAGDAAERLLNDLPRCGYMAVGLVDDEPAKIGGRIHGVSVIGSIDDLPRLVRKRAVEEVLIAIPSATGRQMRRITALCEESGARFRMIPGMSDLINGKVTAEQLRDVKLDDLLGREPIHFDLQAVRQQLTGKVVMVTGAAGSIGSELCAQLLYYKPSKLVCLDQDESALFFLEQKIGDAAAKVCAEYCVADVADRQRMKGLISAAGVDVIFHAAAYKHVPMMETNRSEAVRNNVLALMSLLDVAEQCGCADFLMISSDKAVNPTNVMGCTKRVCELIMAAKPNSKMRRVSVRFGNVLGSQGSVIPVFQEQIRKQGIVTVTHPDITRFFMTIPEAVSLVLQAFTIGKHGEILVLEMGKPIKIVDVARTLVRLCGKSEDDVEIVFTGLRKGEKLHEELFYASESAFRTDVEKIFCTSSKLMSWPVLHEHLRELEGMVYASTDTMIREKLKQIVPEYRYVEEAVPIEVLPSHIAGREAKLTLISAIAVAND